MCLKLGLGFGHFGFLIYGLVFRGLRGPSVWNGVTIESLSLKVWNSQAGAEALSFTDLGV